MKKNFFFVIAIVFFLLAKLTLAQSYLKISFDNKNSNCVVNTDYQFDIILENHYDKFNIQIDSIFFVNPKGFHSEDHQKANFQISPKGKLTVPAKINSKHNLTASLIYYVYYTINELKQSYVATKAITIPFFYNDIYDSFTQNAKGLVLKSALSNYVANHKSYTYKDARIYMFGKFDNVDGWVECVYTGEKVQTDRIPDVNTTHFNNEHTWPQSKGADNEPEKSDIFHMYPTNEYANSKRADFPFGNVVSNVTWSVGNSKLGNDKNGAIVFEPRNSHKGNVARSMFYFAIRYNNPYDYLNYQEETLRTWMDSDTVDAKEMKRNDDIASVQGRRNPFIDHPEFLDRIYSISKNEDYPPKTDYKLSSYKVEVSSFALEEKSIYNFSISNTGNVPFKISSASFENTENDELIKSISYVNDAIVQEDSTLIIEVTFIGNKPSQAQESNLIINIENQKRLVIPFSEKYFNSMKIAETNERISVYPNPANEIINIKYPEHLSCNPQNIWIYNHQGIVINEQQLLINQSNINLQNFPSGNYILRIQQQDREEIIPFIKLR